MLYFGVKKKFFRDQPISNHLNMKSPLDFFTGVHQIWSKSQKFSSPLLLNWACLLQQKCAGTDFCLACNTSTGCWAMGDGANDIVTNPHGDRSKFKTRGPQILVYFQYEPSDYWGTQFWPRPKCQWFSSMFQCCIHWYVWTVLDWLSVKTQGEWRHWQSYIFGIVNHPTVLGISAQVCIKSLLRGCTHPNNQWNGQWTLCFFCIEPYPHLQGTYK